MPVIATDILVIGSGIAGLTFALKAAENFKVAVITKGYALSGNTRFAQGGIACAWNKNDSVEQHIQDTLTAGAGLCNREAVEVLAGKASEAIHALIRLGVPFNLSPEYKLKLGKEGGHSTNRIVHVNDHTGYTVQQALLKSVKAHRNIRLYEKHFLLDLLTQNNTCNGAKLLDVSNNTIKIFSANFTVICTGGVGQVYSNTTNTPEATGDGIAAAYRAGAAVADMEFIQFHPTALYHPNADGFLISEALRGAGARLINHRGERFMLGKHPLAELAPRDIVAASMAREMNKTGAKHLYLDATHLDAHKLRQDFPSIYNQCLKLGIDITLQPIPVTPSAHYLCGGIQTDTWGCTSITKLYAIGEAACTGVHGANRLASNSLLEGMVFADRAIEHIRNNYATNSSQLKENEEVPVILHPAYERELQARADIVRYMIRELMWTNFGISRTRSDMLFAYKELLRLSYIKALSASAPLNTGIRETYNLWTIATLIAKAALLRRKSVGLHSVTVRRSTSKPIAEKTLSPEQLVS